MIEVPTVLVLGAGASKPYGFPTGPELVRLILDGLGEGRPGAEQTALRTFLYRSGFDAAQVNEFRKALRTSRRASIDRFLEYRPEFRELGKLLIAALLLPRQQPDDRLYPAKGDWIPVLLEHFPMDEPAEGLLSVITFNYDTSFEYIVRTALENSYPRDDARRAKMFDEIEIVHVHGKLEGGWMLPNSDEDPAERILWRERSARAAAEGIQIVSEVDEHEDLPVEFVQARRLVNEAGIVCFLGFGYLPANMERLGFLPTDRLHEHVIYLCCATGLGKAELDRAQRAFGRFPEFYDTGEYDQLGELASIPNVIMGKPDQDALTFLREYPVLG